MSKYISPGENFYGYVNASWLNSADIPEYDYATGVSEEIENTIDKQLQTLFLKYKEGPIFTLYQSALTYREDFTSLELLHEMLQRIKTIQTKEEVGTLMGEFARYTVSGFFNPYASYVLENNKQYTYTLGAGSLGIHESYYKKSSLERKAHFNQYKEFVKKLGLLFKLPNLECILSFEKIVARSIVDNSEDQIKRKGSSLLKEYSAVPWDSMFSTFGIESWKQETFYIDSPIWVETLNTLYKEIEVDFWKLYLSYQLILHALPYLPNPYSQEFYYFFKYQLKGQPERMPVYLFATYTVQSWLTPIVNKLYVDHFFSKEKKNRAITLCDELIEGAKDQLECNTWLNKKTIEKAIEKVQKMKYIVAYPSSFSVEEPPSLDTKNLLKNILFLGEWHTQYDLHRLGNPIPKEEVFNDAVFAVNAYYYSETNQMIIPAGTIQEPFFGENLPLGWNYGGLGCIIGHEMTHAFDEDGKDIDPEGNEKKWWTKNDETAFKEKTKSLIQLYSKQRIIPLKISGKKTLDENIADLGGISIALQALSNTFHKGCYTQQEKKEAYRNFFISYAVSWRYKDRKQKRFQSLFMDKHSSSILRVNLIVAQFQEWYEAFDIKENDFLYIPPEKRISIF